MKSEESFEFYIVRDIFFFSLFSFKVLFIFFVEEELEIEEEEFLEDEDVSFFFYCVVFFVSFMYVLVQGTVLGMSVYVFLFLNQFI